MEARPSIDVMSCTVAAGLVFCLFLSAASPWMLLGALSIAVAGALAVRLPAPLFLSCLTIPLLPILMSHLVLEPVLSGRPVGLSTGAHAALVWVRVAGMALLSVSWIKSLDFARAASLCRLVGGGQFLFLPFLVATTFVGVTRERWAAIRELQSLRLTGLLRKRTRIALGELPNVGLQLTMASLFSVGELALSCGGRGIGGRRALAVSLKRPSVGGVLLVLALLVITVMAFRAHLV